MLKAQRAQEQSLKYISGRAAAALDIAACGKGVCVCVCSFCCLVIVSCSACFCCGGRWERDSDWLGLVTGCAQSYFESDLLQLARVSEASRGCIRWIRVGSGGAP